MARRITREKESRILALLQDGLSIPEVARIVVVDPATVRAVMVRRKSQIPHPHFIGRKKSVKEY